MRVTLIHNPSAGRDDQPGRLDLEEMIRAHGHEVTCRRTEADQLASALREPADLIAIAGGDGTVGSIAKHFLMAGDPRIPITAIPLGTANNISKTLGIGQLPIEQWIADWGKARPIALDVGEACGPWGRQYFLEAFGVGLFANTMSQADESEALQQLPDPEAKIAYSLQMLKDRLENDEPLAVRLELDGRDLSGEYLLVETMNLGLVGPNLWLAPRHAPDDGLFDLVLAPAASRAELLDALAKWQSDVWKQPSLPTFKGKTLELEWSGFPIHMDDAAWPQSGADRPAPPARLSLRMHPGALQFLVPDAQMPAKPQAPQRRRAA